MNFENNCDFYSLPEWTKSVFPGGDLAMLTSLCFTTNTTTPILARLKIGFLFREILDRFVDKIKSKLQPNRNLWIYSAHDSTIASVLNSIGLFKVINYYILMIQFIYLLLMILN